MLSETGTRFVSVFHSIFRAVLLFDIHASHSPLLYWIITKVGPLVILCMIVLCHILFYCFPNALIWYAFTKDNRYHTL